MLLDLELSAVVCSGPSQDGEETYALLAKRAPAARRLEREEALAELALRYLAGHGPATERDLSYWASLTLTDARAGLAAVRDRLESVEHEGRTYWFAEPPPADDAPVPAAHLLQMLDEYHNGYQDSRYHFDADGVAPRGRPANVGMALVDGQWVGGMVRTLSGGTATFAVDAFRTLRGREVDLLEQAAERYGSFLGRTPKLVVSPP